MTANIELFLEFSTKNKEYMDKCRDTFNNLEWNIDEKNDTMTLMKKESNFNEEQETFETATRQYFRKVFYNIFGIPIFSCQNMEIDKNSCKIYFLFGEHIKGEGTIFY